jgi:hypothetical protein
MIVEGTFWSIAVSIIFFELVKSYPTIYLVETEITNRQLVTCRIKNNIKNFELLFVLLMK